MRVLNADGTKPSFGAFAGRNLRVWLGGYGLGIPLVALFTMVRQHGRVKAGRAAGELRRGEFELVVVQFDSRFWCTVKIQGKPTSATDPIANRLRDALWTTVE